MTWSFQWYKKINFIRNFFLIIIFGLSRFFTMSRTTFWPFSNWNISRTNDLRRTIISSLEREEITLSSKTKFSALLFIVDIRQIAKNATFVKLSAEPTLRPFFSKTVLSNFERTYTRSYLSSYYRKMQKNGGVLRRKKRGKFFRARRAAAAEGRGKFGRAKKRLEG